MPERFFPFLWERDDHWAAGFQGLGKHGSKEPYLLGHLIWHKTRVTRKDSCLLSSIGNDLACDLMREMITLSLVLC